MPDVDLIVRGGRLVCPGSGLDTARDHTVAAIAIRDGRIVGIGADAITNAARTVDLPDALLLPGLIDLHAHPACEGSKYGVAPDVYFLPRGVTTVLSQGDAGAANWARYRQTTIDASRTRVRLAINLSARGESMPGGCFAQLEDADVEACVAAIHEGGELIWGIAVNVSEITCGATDPREVLFRGLRVVEETGKPLLYGMRRSSDWPTEEQLALLRPGDVVTYALREEPFGIVSDGRVRPAVRDARNRGVLFDVGHGMNSFDFRVAEAAIGAGFPPDTISTDQYARHVGANPPHDLARTMSKLLAAGMGEADVFRAVTIRPAEILGLSGEIGSLRPGLCADVTALEWNENAPPLTDVRGAIRPGGCWEAVCTIRAGEVVWPA